MFRKPAQILLLLAVTLGSASGQDAPYLRAGNKELGMFLGSSYGVDRWRVMGGGNFAYAVNRVVMPYMEFSYFPGIGREGSRTLQDGSISSFKSTIPVTDFHGGVHLRIPSGQSPVVPYVVGAAGVIRFSEQNVDVTVRDPRGQFADIRRQETVPSETNFAVNGGAGIRWYASENIGFRVEVKVYKPVGASQSLSDPFLKVTGGVFWQF
jgi:hypothetical protein